MAHTRRLPTDDQTTDRRQDKRAFNGTGDDGTRQVLTHTLGSLHGSEAQFVEAAEHGEAAEPRGRERRQQSRSGEAPDHQEDRAERNGFDHPGEDESGDEYIKTQNQYTDKATDVTVVIGEIVTQMQTMHRVGEGNLTSEFGLDLRYSERQLVKDTRNESSLRNFMNVSDMQVPDEKDRHDEQSRSQTIKANNKIVKERIWINPVPSKIEIQPLDTDTDA